MHIVPWRVKAFFSRHTPLLYHLVANFGLQGNSEEHWDKRLEETWDDPSRSWPTKNELILRHTRPQMKILDVACGNGGILRALHAAGYRDLHATEISQYAVTRLRQQGINAVTGKLPRIQFPDSTFDLVIASQILEHMVRRAAFIKEIDRVLKPNGESFIFVPDNCLGPIDEPEHVITYTAASLRRFLSRHFEVLAIESMQDRHHPMSVLFARVRKRQA